MNNITREKDIYQVLINANSNYILNDYHKYIIFTYNNVIYDVFISDNIWRHHIQFLIDTNDTTEHQTILLADLLSNNEYGDALKISMRFVSNSEYGKYIDNDNNEYPVHIKENTYIDKLIRHYKVIQKRITNDNTISKKIYLYYSSNNVLYNTFNDIGEARQAQLILKNNHNENTYIIIENHKECNNYNLEQKIESYNDNYYNDNGFELHNDFKNDIIFFDKYYSIVELQDKIINETNKATIKYRNNIIINDTIDSSFTEQIDNMIYYFNRGLKNYLYIRFAPSLEQKYNQAKRVFQIRNIFTDNDNLLESLVYESEIPVYNDNLIYLSNKCKYVEDKNLDTNINITIRIF